MAYDRLCPRFLNWLRLGTTRRIKCFTLQSISEEYTQISTYNKTDRHDNWYIIVSFNTNNTIQSTKHSNCNMKYGKMKWLLKKNKFMGTYQVVINKLLYTLHTHLQLLAFVKKICISDLSYWCSIWKFRCPVNQSLKNDFSISQVATIWSFNQGFSASYSIFIGIWLACATHVNQMDSNTLQQ